MPRKQHPVTQPATAWFDQHPPLPPTWTGKEGWCARHFAPLAAIRDPATRNRAILAADLDLSGTFNTLCAKQAPARVPARNLPEITRKAAPVCCQVGDKGMQTIIRDAATTAGHPLTV